MIKQCLAWSAVLRRAHSGGGKDLMDEALDTGGNRVSPPGDDTVTKGELPDGIIAAVVEDGALTGQAESGGSVGEAAEVAAANAGATDSAKAVSPSSTPQRMDFDPSTRSPRETPAQSKRP